MARSSSTQPANKPESSSSATCDQCGASMRRVADLPRHMLLHAKNKAEFMFTCPVAGCTHQTLQRSNLDTHIRTHTRAKPHKCPEYLSNGQKCLFATADPSSLHRHRKRKHGYQPRAATRSVPVASGSGSREKSVESNVSLESEESFGLRPEADDADPQMSHDTLAYSVHVPYFPSDLKAAGYSAAFPYSHPLDLKVPNWVSSPAHLPSTSQSGLSYGNAAMSSGSPDEAATVQSPQKQLPSTFQSGLSYRNVAMSSGSTDEAATVQWPRKFYDFGATYYCSYDPTFQSYSYPSASSLSCSAVSSYSSPFNFRQEFATCSKEGFYTPQLYGSTSTNPDEYLPLPFDLFPYRSTATTEHTTYQWQ
ncbi:hypothetical protein C8F04DRAFT_1074307 [Mycena alexandri]|uniref:C2H2-type domain-containing protein n=1 Tax=Mycena alexandri TaxID=1745969 RepID=A0AAD6TC78_9AGAR|nr:hypothetical protein C8F04DRAFT_1074307 [Mycena alexandri]